MRTNWAAKLTLPVGERDHIQGSATATITLVEYGDYECPICLANEPAFRQLRQLHLAIKGFKAHKADEGQNKQAQDSADAGYDFPMVFEEYLDLPEGEFIDFHNRMKITQNTKAVKWTNFLTPIRHCDNLLSTLMFL